MPTERALARIRKDVHDEKPAGNDVPANRVRQTKHKASAKKAGRTGAVSRIAGATRAARTRAMRARAR